MDKLTEHYGQLLGLDEFWEASQVDLDLEGKRVEIRLTHRGRTPVVCHWDSVHRIWLLAKCIMTNPYLASSVKRAHGIWSRFFLALLTRFLVGPRVRVPRRPCSVNKQFERVLAR